MEVGSVRKHLFVLFSALLILSACGSSEDEKANTGEMEEEADNENAENNEDFNEIDRDNMNGEVMKLGETGFVDDEIGQYEITPKSVEIFKERDGVTPYNDDEVFVLIDYTVENVGEEPIEAEDVLGFRLLLENAQGNRVDEKRSYDFDFFDKATGTIAPGESYEGQMFFDPPESETDEYTLHFGSSAADVEDAEWFFAESEAK